MEFQTLSSCKIHLVLVILVIRIRDEERESVLEFTGPVFAVDVTGDEIITAGKCLALSDKQVDIMKSTEGISQYSNRSF